MLKKNCEEIVEVKKPLKNFAQIKRIYEKHQNSTDTLERLTKIYDGNSNYVSSLNLKKVSFGIP